MVYWSRVLQNLIVELARGCPDLIIFLNVPPFVGHHTHSIITPLETLIFKLHFEEIIHFIPALEAHHYFYLEEGKRDVL